MITLAGSSTWMDHVCQGSTIFTFLSPDPRVARDRWGIRYSNPVRLVPLRINTITGTRHETCDTVESPWCIEVTLPAGGE